MGKMSLWSCLHLFWVGDVGGKFIFVYLVVWDGEGAPWRGEFTPELARFICLFLVGSPRGTQLYVTHVIIYIYVYFKCCCFLNAGIHRSQ